MEYQLYSAKYKEATLCNVVARLSNLVAKTCDKHMKPNDTQLSNMMNQYVKDAKIAQAAALVAIKEAAEMEEKYSFMAVSNTFFAMCVKFNSV